MELFELYTKAMLALQEFIDAMEMDDMDNIRIATEAMNKLKEVQ